MFFKGLLFSWFVLVFFVSGLTINFIQLCILPLCWIHSRLYYKITSMLCYCLYCEITFLGEWWSEIDLKVYGATEDINLMKKENWITVANHFSDIDWLVAWVFCERVGILGDTMCFMKDPIKYIPTVGWAYWFSGWGFLKREWKKDEETMNRTMDILKNHKHHYCMMLYCEGTRFTKEKLKTSHEYAIKNNIIPLKHHLLPRTKGFSVVVQALKDHVPALYDVEMAFPDLEKATISSLINKTKVEVHLNIRRVPMADVSCSTTEEATDYCLKLYQEKDRLMDYFAKHGCFPGKQHIISRRYWNFVTFAIYNLLSGLLFLLTGKYVIQIYGVYIVLAFLLLVVMGGYALVGILHRLTQTKNGSDFGLKIKKK